MRRFPLNARSFVHLQLGKQTVMSERRRDKEWRWTREGSGEWVSHSTGTEMMHSPPVWLLIAAINIS